MKHLFTFALVAVSLAIPSALYFLALAFNRVPKGFNESLSLEQTHA